MQVENFHDMLKKINDLQESAKRLGTFKDLIYRFLNRKYHGEDEFYFIDSAPGDALVNVTDDKLRIIFDRMTNSSVPESLREVYQELWNEFKKTIAIDPKPIKVVSGEGSPSGDDAVYVGWRIFEETGRNIYLIFTNSARYGSFHIFLFEGDINNFFDAENIGRMRRADERTGEQKNGPIMPDHSDLPAAQNIQPETFDSLYAHLKRHDIINWKS
jgi:hypothetical protein